MKYFWSCSISGISDSYIVENSYPRIFNAKLKLILHLIRYHKRVERTLKSCKVLRNHYLLHRNVIDNEHPSQIRTKTLLSE